ncbi:Gfo/Idh/MocA family protein [Bacillus pseudomycoides]|uniref:Gfo/Idh/MocA family protein n=1 Tax=Bacillus pseudomycoides TaxID=64104 RepID=UPI001FB323FA|nr:Gfo/Idh/MocA family oxidoreductase [Bacillus pseudomycoides]
MKKTYNVGIIGLGFFGRLHLDSLYKNKDVNIVGVCDLSIEKWNEIKNHYKDINFYTAVDELLGQDNIDVVHITTDEETHYEIAAKALSYGKHIFMEKPLVTDLTQANILYKKAKEKNLSIGVGHLLRFESRHKDLKKAIKGGTLGSIECITLRRNFKKGMIDHYGRVNAFITALVHDIDLVQFFSESKIIKGNGVQLLPKLKSYQFNSAVLETENSIVCSLENIWLLPDEYPYDMEFEVVIYGTQGTARTRINPDVEYFTKDTKYSELLINDALDKELKHFIEHVLYDVGELQPTLEEAIHNVEIALHLVEQSKHNKLVDVQTGYSYV